MPNYTVNYSLVTTTTTVRTETAERIITADSLSDALRFANELDYQACGFVVSIDEESVDSETDIEVTSIGFASYGDLPGASVPAVADLGLPPAEYDPEPAPDGSDYNFIQVEPTPRVG